MTREEWDFKQNALRKPVAYAPTGVPGKVEAVVQRTVPSKLSPSGITPAGIPIHPRMHDSKANLVRTK